MSEHNKVERVDEHTLRVTRRSPISGTVRTLDLPITERAWTTYCRGALVQEAFPGLTAGQREFIKTGISDEEWATMFREEEEEE